ARDAVDVRVDSLIRRALFVPLASLPHDEVGPTSAVEFERQRRAGLGWADDTLMWFMDDFARARKRERTDTVACELERPHQAFDDPDMRVFVADHILEIDAAAPGRWRS